MTPPIAIAAVWAGGFALGLAAFAQPGRRPSDRLLAAAAWAAPLGIGCLSVIWFVWKRFAGHSPGALACAVAASAVGATLLAAARRGPPFARAPGPEARHKPTLLEMTAFVLLIGAAAFAVVEKERADAVNPLGGYDSIAIWQVSARTIAEAADPGAALRGLMPSHHGDYPLFHPAALAALFHLTGGESEGSQRGLALLHLLAPALAVLHVLSRRIGAAPAALAATLLLVTPELIEYVQLQYVDPMLAAVLLLAAGAAFGLLGEDEGADPPLLAGIGIALLPWIKNEGIVLAILLAAVFLFELAIAVRRGCARFAVLSPILLAALPVLAAHALFKIDWAPRNDLVSGVSRVEEKLTDGARWSAVSRAFADELDPTRRTEGGRPRGQDRWGFVWVVSAAAIALGAGRLRRPPVRGLFLVVAASTAAWFGVYLLTPSPLEWHLETSLHRLLLQLLPTWVAVAFLAALPARVRNAEAPEPVVPAPRECSR